MKQCYSATKNNTTKKRATYVMIHVSGTLPSDQRPTLIDCSPAVAVDESPAVVSSIVLRFSFRQQIHRLVD